jgi:hypothetical protein
LIGKKALTEISMESIGGRIMKLNAQGTLVFILIAAVLGLGWVAQKNSDSRWEYKVVELKTDMQLLRPAPEKLTLNEAALNHLGAQGWELVDVERDKQNGINVQTDYIFKRLKQ